MKPRRLVKATTFSMTWSRETVNGGVVPPAASPPPPRKRGGSSSRDPPSAASPPPPHEWGGEAPSHESGGSVDPHLVQELYRFQAPVQVVLQLRLQYTFDRGHQRGVQLQ